MTDPRTLFSQRETSRAGGQPIALVAFTSGGQGWYLTTDAESQVHLNTEFEPVPCTIGPQRQSGEADAGSVEIRLPRDHALADLLLTGLLFDSVGVRVFLRHRPTTEVSVQQQLDNPALAPPTVVHFVGQVATSTVEGLDLVVTCRPLQGLLEQAIPTQVISKQCRHLQYGHACGLSLEDWTESHAVASVSADGMELTIPTLFAGGWVDTETHFQAGVVRYNGRFRMIVWQSTTTIRLLGPFPEDLTGQTVEIAPSCGRNIDRCRVDFDNLRQYGGFIAHPEQNPFEGRLI